MNHGRREHILLLIYSVLPILILFEAIAQKHWVLLCFVLCFIHFCAFFSLFFLLSTIWMLNWDLSLLWGWLFGHRYVVVALGLPSPCAGTRWEVPPASTPNCSDASWQLRWHPGEEVWAGACLGPVLLFLALLWKIKLSSTLDILLGNGNGKHHLPAACLVVVAKSWVSFAPQQPLSAKLECCGKTSAEAFQLFVLVMQQLHRLPLSWRIGATCPGFARWFWLLRIWIYNWTWRHSVLLLGDPKVALTAEQQKWILGTCTHFPNGEIRNWVENLTLSKEKSPKCTSSYVFHPPLVPNRYFDGQAHTSMPMKGRGVAQTVIWTLIGLFQCFVVVWVILSRTTAPRHIINILCFCVPPVLLPFSRDTGECSYRGGAGHTMSSDAPSPTSCTASTVMNRSATRISEQGQPFLEEYLHQHGSLQLDFSCSFYLFVLILAS